MLRILRPPMSRDVWLLAGYNGYSCAPYITFLHTSKWPPGPRTISLALFLGGEVSGYPRVTWNYRTENKSDVLMAKVTLYFFTSCLRLF